MRYGQEFMHQGKKYAYRGFNNKGNIKMQDVKTKKNYSFNANVTESSLEVLETINQNVIDERDLETKREMESQC